jgi:hypothetical protein
LVYIYKFFTKLGHQKISPVLEIGNFNKLPHLIFFSIPTKGSLSFSLSAKSIEFKNEP